MSLKQMESHKVDIGGSSFYIKPFPAFKAANLTGELASVLSPLIGVFAPFVGDNKDVMDIDVNEAAKALSGTTAINGDKLEGLMAKLLLGGNVVVEYEDDSGEVHQETLKRDLADEFFCGNVQDMFVLCIHVIRLNFWGFFEKLTALSGKADKAVTKKALKKL
jgi:hypothetical protein|nr:MAG TPA: tail assembly chaperone protein [Caudoviricetes sp.]